VHDSVTSKAKAVPPVKLIIAGLICFGPFTMGRIARVAPDLDSAQILGKWSGESICQVKNSPCRDEKVIYHLAKSKEPDKVNVSADKIVDGSPVNMGSIEFIYDRKNQTLISESSRGVWKFIVHGKSMEGTLTLPDKTLYRRIILREDDN
jgi:hypothetical protein